MEEQPGGRARNDARHDGDDDGDAAASQAATKETHGVVFTPRPLFGQAPSLFSSVSQNKYPRHATALQPPPRLSARHSGVASE